MNIGIIDRYVLRQFVQVFVICYTSLTGLYIVFDAFTNLDAFMAFADAEDQNLLLTLLRYYSYQSIAFFDQTAGMLGQVSVMFTITWLQRHNEMTALLAAGVSRFRVIRPAVVAVISLSLLAAANRELVIPRFQKELSQSSKNLSGDQAQTLKPRYDNLTDILIRGRSAVPKDQEIEEPSFLLPPGLDRYGRQLMAAAAYYRKPQEGRPGGYLMKTVTAPEDLASQPSLLGRDGEPVILTPTDTPWLNPGECFVLSDVDFEQLTAGDSWRRFSSTAGLVRGLSNRSLDFGADVRVIIHSRLVKPLADVTLLFLGLPLILSRDNRNIFVAVGLSLVVVIGFTVTVFAAQYLGNSVYISPQLAAWLPLIVYVPVAVAVSKPLST